MIDPVPRCLQARPSSFAAEPEPGISVLSVSATAWEHFDIRIGDGGPPGARKQARPAGARLRDRPRRDRTGDRTARRRSGAALEPLDSVVFLEEQPATTGRTGRATATDRSKRGGCSSRRAAAGARTGSTSVPASGSRFASRRLPASRRRERTVELAQAQLRQVGVEVSPGLRASSVVFGQILASGDFDVVLFGWIVGASTSGPSTSSAAAARSNYTGYCHRLVTRDLDQATRILDDGRTRRAPEQDRRAGWRRTSPPSRSIRPRPGALRATVRGVVPSGADPFTWNAEDWWLER